MKNREILNINYVLNHTQNVEAVVKNIQCTLLHYTKLRAARAIAEESKIIYEVLDQYKSDRFKELTEKQDRSEAENAELTVIAAEFEAQPQVEEFLLKENDLVLSKIKLSDLPSNLTSEQFEAIEFLIEG